MPDFDFDATAERGGGLLEEPERRHATYRVSADTADQARAFAAADWARFCESSKRDPWDRPTVAPGSGPREGVMHLTMEGDQIQSAQWRPAECGQ